MMVFTFENNAPQRLCLRSGGLSKPRPVHVNKRYKINIAKHLDVTPPLRKHFVGSWRLVVSLRSG